MLFNFLKHFGICFGWCTTKTAVFYQFHSLKITIIYRAFNFSTSLANSFWFLELQSFPCRRGPLKHKIQRERTSCLMKKGYLEGFVVMTSQKDLLASNMASGKEMNIANPV